MPWGGGERASEQAAKQNPTHGRESLPTSRSFHFFVFIRRNRAQFARQ
jgi:hypothetical protein